MKHDFARGTDQVFAVRAERHVEDVSLVPRQPTDELARLQVPHGQHAVAHAARPNLFDVAAAYRQESAVGGQRDTIERLVLLDLHDVATRIQSPEEHDRIVPPAGQCPAVRGERDGAGRAPVAKEGGPLAACGDIEHPHRAVPPGGRQEPAVGAEADVKDGSRVTAEQPRRPAGDRVQYPNRSVAAARRQQGAVRAEGQAPDAVGVRREEPLFPAGDRVPELHFRGRATGRVDFGRGSDKSPGGADRDRRDRPCLGREGLHALPGLDVPDDNRPVGVAGHETLAVGPESGVCRAEAVGEQPPGVRVGGVTDQTLAVVSSRHCAAAVGTYGQDGNASQFEQIDSGSDLACRHVPDVQAGDAVPTVADQPGAVCREGESGYGPRGFGAAVNETAALGVTEPPQVVPLEAAQVAAAGPRPQRFEQDPGADDVVVAQGGLREAQVGPVELAAGLVALGPQADDEGPRPGQQRRRRQAADSRQRGQRRPALRPLPGPLERPDRPGLDRLAGKGPPQVVGQRRRAGVAPGRVLMQALEANRLQVARHLRLQPTRRHRVVHRDLHQRVQRRRGPERWPPRQALVEDRPQRVHVGRPPDRLAAGLLGRHVRRRSQDRAAGRLPRLVEFFRQPEVGDLGRDSVGEKHVGRFQVAVHDLLPVGRRDGPRQDFRQPGRLGRGQGEAAELLRQAAAGAELQGEERQAVVFADLVDLDDVRVRQPSRRLRLGPEAGQPGGVGVASRQDHLQRHQPVQLQVACLVDDAHAAATQLPQHLVTRHLHARRLDGPRVCGHGGGGRWPGDDCFGWVTGSRRDGRGLAVRRGRPGVGRVRRGVRHRQGSRVVGGVSAAAAG